MLAMNPTPAGNCISMQLQRNTALLGLEKVVADISSAKGKVLFSDFVFSFLKLQSDLIYSGYFVALLHLEKQTPF